MTIRRGSAHYRLSLAGGGTDLGDGEGLCITLSLPWKCHVVRTDVWGIFDGKSRTYDPDWIGNAGGPWCTDRHPILKHLSNVESQHHFIVTHELPTRVGLGSSAALALAATCGDVAEALRIDRVATGAGWQDVWGCAYEGIVIYDGVSQVALQPKTQMLEGAFLLFSTGGTHTESRNASELEPMLRQLALAEARKLRDNPTLETLQWCMQRQWERKMVHAPDDVCRAIHAASKTPGFMSAKSTGSRGAGFGVVLSTQREKARDALVECGARVWLV